MAYISFQPHDHFNTLLYTGDGSGSDRTLTGVGFQPDWLWNKSRSNAYNHYIFDAVRGTNMISSNTTGVQEDKSPQFSAFTSDGFTIRNDAGSLAINASGVTFANWCWKAGGGQGSSNTDGSINTTYTSVNTTAGFSISQYTGTGSAATVGHGLGAVPKVMIIKNLGQSVDWTVYHASIGATKNLHLNTTDAEATSSAFFNDTTPTSSVFSISSANGTNSSGQNLVAYCFAEKTGFSKFGSYVGNGNADGAFVYTGFKPAFFLFKKSSASGNDWGMFDNKRSTFNEVDKGLKPNDSGAEYTANDCDFLSNGVKMRSTGGDNNGSGATYIYMAFAEEPLVSSNGVPAVAR